MEQLGRGIGAEAQSPILPLILGSEAAAVAASTALLEKGFYVPAIRPPTVAPGTSRSVSLARITSLFLFPLGRVVLVISPP